MGAIVLITLAGWLISGILGWRIGGSSLLSLVHTLLSMWVIYAAVLWIGTKLRGSFAEVGGYSLVLIVPLLLGWVCKRLVLGLGN